MIGVPWRVVARARQAEDAATPSALAVLLEASAGLAGLGQRDPQSAEAPSRAVEPVERREVATRVVAFLEVGRTLCAQRRGGARVAREAEREHCSRREEHGSRPAGRIIARGISHASSMDCPPREDASPRSREATPGAR